MRLSRLALMCVVVVLSCTALFSQSNQGKSVADIAREYKEKQRDMVRIGPAEAKELFSTLDQMLAFVSRDTGFARHGTVNRKLIGRKELDAEYEKLVAEDAVDQELERSEVVLKKFGLLPKDYGVKHYLTNVYTRQIGAFYRPKDKTMYLLNWIELEKQEKIMPHELTHALQDQNYDLAKYGRSKGEQESQEKKPEKPAPSMKVDEVEDSERLTAQQAFIEGQAMLVYYDYLLSKSGLGTELKPELLKALQQELQEYDGPFSMRNAPMVLEASAMFPYREGLSFELELLKRGGRKAAFADVFARPPKDTHEILEPAAYLANKRATIFTIPDLKPVLSEAYQAYDTGLMGEFDVQIMARQFGRDNDLYSVVPFWNGGGYIAVKRAGAPKAVTTGDVALLYVSNWKKPEAAIRLAKIYKAALPKRVQVLKEDVIESSDCEDEKCMSPLWAARVATNEGPVFIEVWPGNRLLISQSFDDRTFGALRKAVLTPTPNKATTSFNHELLMGLYESPTFSAFQERVGEELLERVAQKVIH